jgi:L-asparaginase II
VPQPRPEPQVLVEVVRSGVVESRHRGSVVALAPDGRAVLTVGDVEQPVFPRSSNKPLQALAMVRAGLDLDGELLALACASHSGEPLHLDGVRRILAAAGLGLGSLQTPPELPLGEQARQDRLRDGGGPDPLSMNCSGKHAAMLATCVRNGWPTRTYLEADHPLQRAVAECIQAETGEAVAHTVVDGCGAPQHAVSLTGLARAFAGLATAIPGTDAHRVAEAVRQHPHWLGGPGRDVTELVEGLPGVVAKDGAEGVFAAALPDGGSVALKIEDGAGRARGPVLAAALRALGADAPVLDRLARQPVLGGGREVGEVRATTP